MEREGLVGGHQEEADRLRTSSRHARVYWKSFQSFYRLSK
jgi:hypothetical protein